MGETMDCGHDERMVDSILACVLCVEEANEALEQLTLAEKVIDAAREIEKYKRSDAIWGRLEKLYRAIRVYDNEDKIMNEKFIIQNPLDELTCDACREKAGDEVKTVVEASRLYNECENKGEVKCRCYVAPDEE